MAESAKKEAELPSPKLNIVDSVESRRENIQAKGIKAKSLVWNRFGRCFTVKRITPQAMLVLDGVVMHQSPLWYAVHPDKRDELPY